MDNPKVKRVPDGMHTVTPHLICAGAADAIEFYKRAFNAVEVGRVISRRIRSTGTCLAVALAVAGGPGCGMFRAQPAAATHGQPTLDEVRRRVEEMDASIKLQPPKGQLGVPSPSPDPSAPGSTLRRVARVLASYGDRRPATASQRTGLEALKQARTGIDTGLAAYGTQPEIRSTFTHLDEAARQLAVASSNLPADRPAIQAAARDMARAARAIAVRLRGLGDGSPPTSARSTGDSYLAQADMLVASARYTNAVPVFGQVGFHYGMAVTFDLTAFRANIQNAVEDLTVGYGYEVRLGPQEWWDADGVARTHPDVPDEIAPVPQSSFKEMYTASISKTITAIAVLHVLDAHGISVDDKIAPYLPDDWVQGPNVDDISFRHLLTHVSGLSSPSGDAVWNQTFAALKEVIADGSTGIVDFEDAGYFNEGFALMRVLIPQISPGEGVVEAYSNVFREDEVYAALYADYVHTHVFEPSGVTATTCAPDEPYPAQTVGYLYGGPGSYQAGNWSLGCGATGWYVSAHEQSNLLDELRFHDSLLDGEMRDTMDAGFLGWLNPVKFSAYVVGKWGEYRGHGGDSHSSNSVPGYVTCMMNFPNGAQASLMINSRGNPGGHACKILRDAHDNAWS